ncbi:hypothetical protein AC1031_009671 [Aphanomyces cochlioides]|nr:hypothetical protein AC1031_009671 [Aphanomyces cochlioides]
MCSRGAVVSNHFRHGTLLERDIDNTDCAKGRRIKSEAELLSTTFGHPSYNDLKAVILLSLVMRKHHEACPSIGGSLHRLYHKNPRYRSMPLFSHRATDVFVVCYDADGRADKRIVNHGTRSLRFHCARDCIPPAFAALMTNPVRVARFHRALAGAFMLATPIVHG